MSETKATGKDMTNQRFFELLNQIKDYAEECNDAQKIIQYLDQLMEETNSGIKAKGGF